MGEADSVAMNSARDLQLVVHISIEAFRKGQVEKTAEGNEKNAEDKNIPEGQFESEAL